MGLQQRYSVFEFGFSKTARAIIPLRAVEFCQEMITVADNSCGIQVFTGNFGWVTEFIDDWNGGSLPPDADGSTFAGALKDRVGLQSVPRKVRE